jgi:hypothetical protein
MGVLLAEGNARRLLRLSLRSRHLYEQREDCGHTDEQSANVDLERDSKADRAGTCSDLRDAVGRQARKEILALVGDGLRTADVRRVASFYQAVTAPVPSQDIGIVISNSRIGLKIKRPVQNDDDAGMFTLRKQIRGPYVRTTGRHLD